MPYQDGAKRTQDRPPPGQQLPGKVHMFGHTCQATNRANPSTDAASPRVPTPPFLHLTNHRFAIALNFQIAVRNFGTGLRAPKSRYRISDHSSTLSEVISTSGYPTLCTSFTTSHEADTRRRLNLRTIILRPHPCTRPFVTRISSESPLQVWAMHAIG